MSSPRPNIQYQDQYDENDLELDANQQSPRSGRRSFPSQLSPSAQPAPTEQQMGPVAGYQTNLTVSFPAESLLSRTEAQAALSVMPDTLSVTINEACSTLAVVGGTENCFISKSLIETLSLPVRPVPQLWIKEMLVPGVGRVTPTYFCVFNCDIEWFHLQGKKMEVLVVEEWRLPEPVPGGLPFIGMMLGKRFIDKQSCPPVTKDEAGWMHDRAETTPVPHHTQPPASTRGMPQPDPSGTTTIGSVATMAPGNPSHTRFGNLHGNTQILSHTFLDIPKFPMEGLSTSRLSPGASSASWAATTSSNLFSGNATGPSPSTSNHDPAEPTLNSSGNVTWSSSASGLGCASGCGCGALCGCVNECAMHWQG